MMAMDKHLPFPYNRACSSDWDPHTASGDNITDLFEQQLLQLTPMAMASPVSYSRAASSTGYLLQDAVAEWSDRGKRRLLAASPSPPPSDWAMTSTEELQDLLPDFWDYSCHGDPTHSVNLFQEDNAMNPGNYCQSKSSRLLHQSTHAKQPCTSKGKAALTFKVGRDNSKSKGVGVAYPFTVVKPGGVEEGEVTLSDINARILMRPRRPVRHPVGEHARCGPVKAAGLSGKAVVSLTRIQTRGRGTITIIRTKG